MRTWKIPFDAVNAQALKRSSSRPESSPRNHHRPVVTLRHPLNFLLRCVSRNARESMGHGTSGSVEVLLRTRAVASNTGLKGWRSDISISLSGVSQRYLDLPYYYLGGPCRSLDNQLCNVPQCHLLRPLYTRRDQTPPSRTEVSLIPASRNA